MFWCLSIINSLKDRPSLLPNILYNLGRATTYGILGAIMGGAASFTRFTEGIGGLQQAVLVGAGLLIVVMGIAMTGWLPSNRLFGNFTPANQFINKNFKRLFAQGNNLVFFLSACCWGFCPADRSTPP